MPYILPSRADVHVNRPLTNISLAFMQDASNFVADRVFPVVPVAKQSDLYFTYDRGMFNRDQMQRRAPGTPTAGINYTVATAPYVCQVWGLHKDVDDQTRANADAPLGPDREATELLSMQGLIRKEVNWAAGFFVPAVWTTNLLGVPGVPIPGQFQQWNQAASTPIEDSRGAKTTVQGLTGFRPNILTLARPVYDALLDHPDIVGRIDRGQTTGTALVLRQNLAALFEVDEIDVMDGIVNTALEGAANVHAFIAGNHALLTYRPAAPGLMVPSAGYTFSWNGLFGAGALGTRIKRFRMEPNAADRVEIEMAFDHRLIAADLGFFFQTAV